MLTWVEGFRPTWMSLVRKVIAGNVYMVFDALLVCLLLYLPFAIRDWRAKWVAAR